MAKEGEGEGAIVVFVLWVRASAARGASRAGALSANPNVCWKMHENSGKLGESWGAEEKQVYFNFGYKLYEFPFILLILARPGASKTYIPPVAHPESGQ